MAANTTFVKAQDELRGKRAACVANMIEQLAEADGEPIAWADMCDEAGMDHHGQLMPAMHALELVGAIDRYEYSDGGTRSKPAFALADGVEVVTES
jgi:hypothetical protein